MTQTCGGIRFQRLQDFNLAMLGKQGWCLMVNPDSLVSHVFKALYFASTDFLNSQLGNSPSFIWRSVFAAKDVILSGVRWRVGSGENIGVMGATVVDKRDYHLSL